MCVVVGIDFEKVRIKKALEEFIKIVEESEKEKERILDSIDYNKVTKKELVAILYEILIQDCWTEKGREGFSHCMSAYAEGLRILAKLGLFEIKDEAYRCIRGEFKGW